MLTISLMAVSSAGPLRKDVKGSLGVWGVGSVCGAAAAGAGAGEGSGSRTAAGAGLDVEGAGAATAEDDEAGGVGGAFG
jgi:hypothetical protein